MSALFTEEVALLEAIDPDANTAATLTSGWVNFEHWHKMAALVALGALGTSATIDAKIEQASDSSGTGAKDITGKAITQLTDAGTDSDKQAWINIGAEELDVANDFNHVRLSLTTAVATSDAAMFLFGLHPRFAPANDNDLASVDEIVT